MSDYVNRYRVTRFVFAIGLIALYAPRTSATNIHQGFDNWTATSGSGTHTNSDGWVLSDATPLIQNTRFFPYDAVSAPKVGLFESAASSTNSFLLTPLLPEGARTVTFWALPKSAGNTFDIQFSPDGVRWSTVEQVAMTAVATWQFLTTSLSISDSGYLRLLHTGTPNQTGVDDVTVALRPAVELLSARLVPSSPTIDDSIHIWVDVSDVHPRATNLALYARYRFDEIGPFARRPMTEQAPGAYRTEAPIQAGRAGTFDYYVEATFGGLSYSIQPYPADAPSNTFHAVITGSTGANSDPRQLGPCTRLSPLTLSEIMYHPQLRADGLDLEFVEIRNTESTPYDLTGHRVSGDIDYDFPPNTILPPRSCLVVAKAPADIFIAYPISYVLGPYEGRLPNGRGTVRLRNSQDAVLVEVEYNDDWPWPTQADGAGHALVLAKPDYGEASRLAWRAGATIGGSPGISDAWPADPLSHVVINEVLAHTDIISDFIELYNTGTRSADISGCVLSDNLGANVHVIAPGTTLPSGGFLAFDTNQLGFALSMAGADIYLLDTNGNRVIDAVRYPAQVNGVSSGRYPDGTPEFRVLASRTPGEPNSGRYVQDIVINEIMYHPITGRADDEYIELHNRSTHAVDLSAWRFTEGVSYVFPGNTTVESGGFLVVARNAAHMISNYTHLTSANTLGNFTGTLSDRGERLVLSRPDDPQLPDQDFVVVDTVEYGDGPRWGRWTDGGGSSLELRDPHSDNRRAMNWAGSDETGTDKAPWTHITWTGVLDHGSTAPNELHVLLLDAGECLVDDLEVVGSGGNLLQNGTFESGLSGWIIQGTHIDSVLETGEGHASSPSLRLRASATGDNGVNRVEKDLSSSLSQGSSATISGWVRWQAGGPGILLRLRGNWLEAAGEMIVPKNLGTPGQVNSCYTPNAGPAISDVAHFPVVPTPSQPVIVTARLDDPDGIANASVRYRVDPSTSVTSLPMVDNGTGADAVAGDGVYSATIPGRSDNTLVAFTVTASDGHASQASTQFPESSPDRECHILFGQDTPAGNLGIYRFWMTSATVQEWETRQKFSDHALDGTFVYGDFRALYEGGARYRGSPFIRPGYSSPETSYASFLLYVPKDERLLGSRSFNMDRLELDNTYQRERVCLWMADQIRIPHFRQRHVHVYMNEFHKGTIYADAQQPNWEYVSSWYPDDDDGVLLKIDDWFEFADPDGSGQVRMDFSRNGRLEKYTTTGGQKKKARYRWSWWREQGNQDGFSDDYTSLFTAVDALNLNATTQLYETWVSHLIDYKQWMAEFAFRHVIRDWDSYAYNRGKNTSTYRPTRGRWTMHPWDLDRDHLSGNALEYNLFSIEDPVMKDKFFTRPRFLRAYWGAIHALAYGPMESDRCNPVLDDNYAAFTANGVSVTSPDSGLKAWIATRRQFLIGALATVSADFKIETNGGNDLSTDQSPFSLAGSAPVHVQALRLNGKPYITSYDGLTDWSMQVALLPGPNVLKVEGEDWYGNVVTSDTITVTFTGSTPSPFGQLVINEIMYHPVIADTEFVEIHNISTHTFDLSGWRINGLDFTFPAGTLIGPSGYVIAVENVPNFAEAYTDASAVLAIAGQSNGTLDNGGENLELLMPSGTNAWILIDSVRFDDNPPWPAAADGLGYSLQLVDPTQDNDRITNWRTSQGLPQPAAMSTPGAPNNTATTLPDFPELWINEIMPSNVLALADNANEFEPWIELHNSGAVPIDLGSGYYLSDDASDLTQWAFPAGQMIDADGYLVVFADGEVFQNTNGYLHANWRMNSSSGLVVLVKDDRRGRLVLDALSYGPITPDYSYGSYPEGGGSRRQVFHFPSPGSANSPTSQVVLIRINEWMSDNGTFIRDPSDDRFDDWFELYNYGDMTANLGGFSITDDIGKTNRFIIPGGTLIPPKQHLLVWADGDIDQNSPGGDLHVDFSLNKSGDVIALFAPDGLLVDMASFGPQLENTSDGSWPDGALAVHAMTPPTPGAANRVFAVTGLSLDSPQTAIAWSAEPGKTYTLSRRVSLVTGVWEQVGVVTAVDTTVSLVDTQSPPRRVLYYRISRPRE